MVNVHCGDPENLGLNSTTHSQFSVMTKWLKITHMQPRSLVNPDLVTLVKRSSDFGGGGSMGVN